MSLKKQILIAALTASSLLFSGTSAMAQGAAASAGKGMYGPGDYQKGYVGQQGRLYKGAADQSMGGEKQMQKSSDPEVGQEVKEQTYKASELMPGTQFWDKPGNIPASAVSLKLPTSIGGLWKNAMPPMDG